MIFPNKLAKYICYGFMFHDKKDYNQAITNFANLYTCMFKINESDAILMGRYFVNSLKLHDSIEDNFRGSKLKFFKHKIWKKIHKELLKFCDVIDLDRDYAYYYTKFLRYHSAYQKNFEIPLLRAEEIIIFHITKDMQIAKIAAPLYVAGVNSHDVHRKFTWKLNEKIMTIFYSLVLKGG